eukprot:COSAG04_NODE_29238_length_270_cov_0.883041_1_plen_81_part_10
MRGVRRTPFLNVKLDALPAGGCLLGEDAVLPLQVDVAAEDVCRAVRQGQGEDLSARLSLRFRGNATQISAIIAQLTMFLSP